MAHLRASVQSLLLFCVFLSQGLHDYHIGLNPTFDVINCRALEIGTSVANTTKETRQIAVSSLHGLRYFRYLSVGRTSTV
jgi:hypothetical protein